MIELRNVRKSYGDQVVLDGVNLIVPDGACKVVLGGSGSGKSVLLRILGGLERPDSGEVILDGQDISRLPESRLADIRRGIGIVFQEGGLFDSLTIRENVAYRLFDEGGWPDEEVESIVLRLLGYVGLAHTIDRFPSQLSGGMRRRVAIARAMAGKPPVMLYDEPTAGLDPVTSRTICDLLLGLRDLENVTSVVVTHDLNAAFFLADYAAREAGEEGLRAEPARNEEVARTSFCVLDEGRILFDGSRDELVSCEEPYVREFIT